MQTVNLSDKSTSDLIDNSEFLVKLDEHLQFTEELISRHDIPKSTRKDLLKQVKKIRKKSSDSTLKLAIIGEFSSGKSTFINALLREELLKISAKPTTAAATYISSGEAIEVEVVFKNGHELKRLKTGDFQTNGSQVTTNQELDDEIPDVRQFIHQVTAEEDITTLYAF